MKCVFCKVETEAVEYHDCPEWQATNDTVFINGSPGKLRVCPKCGLVYVERSGIGPKQVSPKGDKA